MKGDTLFTIGAGTVVGSAATYVLLAIYGVGRFVLNMAMSPDMFAVPLVGFLFGLVVAAVGWYLGEYQRQKGTPYVQRSRRHRAD